MTLTIGAGVEIAEDAAISQLELLKSLSKFLSSTAGLRSFCQAPEVFVEFLELTYVSLGGSALPSQSSVSRYSCVTKWGTHKAVTRAHLVYDAHELESAKGGQTRILSAVTLFMKGFAGHLLICLFL